MWVGGCGRVRVREWEGMSESGYCMGENEMASVGEWEGVV